MKKMAPSIRKLFDAAKKARLHSYSPYSNCKVGAAIRTKSGKIYGGASGRYGCEPTLAALRFVPTDHFGICRS